MENINLFQYHEYNSIYEAFDMLLFNFNTLARAYREATIEHKPNDITPEFFYEHTAAEDPQSLMNALRKLPKEVERDLLSTDTEGRKFIFRRLFRNEDLYDKMEDDDEYPSSIYNVREDKCQNDGNVYLLEDKYKNDIIFFLAETCSDPYANAIEKTLFETHDFIRLCFLCITSLCKECGFNVSDFAKCGFVKHLSDIKPAFDENNAKYDKMKRAYRVAALWGLIEQTKCCPGIDHTRIAAFIEGVTGGNISAEPKDCYAYKPPERSARKEAAKWLRKIGIDTKE